jgi:hypothetical protein
MTVGSGPITLNVTGVDLTNTSLVQWNGVSLETQFVSPTQLQATVTNTQLTVPGTASVRVWDPESGQISNTLAVTVVAGAAPSFVEVQNGSTATLRTESVADDEVEFDLMFSPAYGSPLDVEATLTFTPDASINVSQNPTVRFTTHDQGDPRQATVSVLADSGVAGFADQGMHIATGTVAGNIRLSLRYWITSDGERVAEVTPSPAPTHQIRVQAGPPQVSTACFDLNGTNLQVRVWGFSPIRQVTSAVFQFSGTNLTSNTVTVDSAAASAFQSWFGDTNSHQHGGSFLYTQPFTISGNASDVTGVSGVTVTSSQGSSARFTSVARCP